MSARAALSAGCAALALSPAVPAAAGAAVVLEDGHVDVAARLVDGGLRMQVKDGTAGAGAVVWREPADAVLHARPASATTVPAGAALSFLGAPGTPLWLLPQVQRAGLLWPGWNTEQLTSAEVAGPVRWTLTGVEGPGSFALFTTGTFGTVDTLFDTGDGLPDAREIPLGTHAHGNWAFGAEGLYRLAFELSARRPSGETMTDARTIAVTVGAVDPSTGAPLGGGLPDPGRGGTGGSDPGAPGGGGPGPGGSGGQGGSGGGDPSSDGGPRTGRRDDAKPGRGALLLRLATRGGVRLNGRRLELRMRVATRSRVRVTVHRRGRVVARGPVLVVGPRSRVLHVRLDRRLAPGAYRVRLTARAGARCAATTLALRVARS
jgi:putative ABC transporter-associated repeat protein